MIVLQPAAERTLSCVLRNTHTKKRGENPRNFWRRCGRTWRRSVPATPVKPACFRHVFSLLPPVGGNLIPGDNGWVTLLQRSRFTGDPRRRPPLPLPSPATARLQQQQVSHQARTRQQRQLCVRNGSEISRNAGTAKNKLAQYSPLIGRRSHLCGIKSLGINTKIFMIFVDIG